MRVGDNEVLVILNRGSDDEKPEPPPAVADLQVQLATYRAALSVYAAMMPTSLIDFLK